MFYWFSHIFGVAFYEESCFFDIDFCIDFDRLFGGKLSQNGSQQLWVVPPLFAPKIDPGAQADFWMPFGPPLVPFWRPLAPFWLPLAPLGSFLAPFWLLLALLGSVLAPFGRPLVPFRRPLAPFCSLFIPFYNIFATMALVGATFAPICAFPTFRMSNFFNNLVFWAPEAATHPLSIRFRFLLIPNTIFA